MSLKHIKQPKFGRWLLNLILIENNQQGIIGDFEEAYNEIVNEYGIVYAWQWYWWQIVKSIPAFITSTIYWGFVMFKNYLIIAVRNMVKHKMYSLINISGLAIGIACCILILLFVQDELSYDQFHEKANRIYRLDLGRLDNGIPTFAKSAAIMAPILSKNFPEIENTVRLRKFPSLISYRDNRFYENKFFFTDSTFFDVFSFEIVEGDPKHALTAPYSLVITKSMAEKYFNNEDALGKLVTIDNSMTFKVNAIIKDPPENSHFKFDLLASISTLPSHPNEPLRTYQLTGWYAHYFYTYFLLAENTSAKELDKKIREVSKIYSPPDEYELYGQNMGLFIQPLKDIHLNPMYGEIEPQGEMTYIYVFSSIALFILLMACINYMNLATARSINRAKEVGMRKVVGANKKNLIPQFLGESILLSFLALIIAIFIVELFMPVFNTLAAKSLDVQPILNMTHITSLLAITLFVGIIGGSYPAFVLSSYKPVSILMGTIKNTENTILRKSIVVFQFTISIILFAGTLIIYHQTDFMLNRDLGIQTEQVIAIPTHNDREINEQYNIFNNELIQHPDIVSTTISELTPGNPIYGIIARFEGMDNNKNFPTMAIGYNYLKTYGLELSAGRNFSRDIATDRVERVIVNESLVKSLGWSSPEEAIGKKYDWGGDGETPGEIIGVVKDFHFRSLKLQIRPLVMAIYPNFYSNFSIRVNTERMDQTLSQIEVSWKKLFPNRPFEYSFVDEDFARQYQSEKQLSNIFTGFSLLAILIACLGLLGLITFVAKQRTKEIGIRKVLGASESNIIWLLSQDFIKLALLANIIAWPISYFVMDKWLQDFAYRIVLGYEAFLLSSMFTLTLSIITVSFQAIKAANTNPVEALRHE